MTDALAFEAIKMKWHQDKDGYILTLRVHPQDVKEPIAMAPIGQQWYLAVLDKSAPTQTTLAAASSNADATPDEVGKSGVHPLVQRAGILAKSRPFQDWAGSGYAVPDEDIAVKLIRSECGIQSRKELATNPEAARKFTALLERYYAETR